MHAYVIESLHDLHDANFVNAQIRRLSVIFMNQHVHGTLASLYVCF